MAESEDEVVARLLAGDRETFLSLVDAHHATMVRVARTFVRSWDLAEEVAQETWLAVLEGLPRFEGRSSLRTWLFRILANRARTRAKREARSTPFSALGEAEDGVDPDFFDAQGFWRAPPERWVVTPTDSVGPELAVAQRELVAIVAAALEALPARQRAVVELRDVQGWSSEEVCNALELTETNQRVLLHRARAKIRAALTPHLEARVAP